MKKYSWIVALLAALALVLVGCGDPSSNNNDDDDDDDDGELVKALKVTVISNWAGFDLQNGGASGLAFEAGDEIELKVSLVTSGAQILLNIDHDGWEPIGGWNPDGPVSLEEVFTLTAAEVASIAAATPSNIRIRSNQANAVFILEELKVTRGTTVLFDLADIIADVPVGEIADQDAFNTIFDGTAAAAVGGIPGQVKYEIIEQ